MTILKRVQRLEYVAAMGIATFMGSSPAHADMILTLRDASTGSTATIDDSGTGDIFYTSLTSHPATLGNFKISSITVSANYDGNIDGNTNFGDANVDILANVTLSRNATVSSDSLIIQVTTSGSASWSNPASSSVFSASTLSVSRMDGSTGSPTGSFSTFASTVQSGTDHATVQAPNAYGAVTTTNREMTPSPGTPFYLSNILTINLKGKNDTANLSASTDVTAVPEPSTAFLVIAGGVLMIAAGRRPRHRDQ